MTLKYIYAGSEQTELSTRLKGEVQSLSTAADGTFTTSTWVIRDPTGVLDYTQLQEFLVEETLASPARCTTGLIYGLTVHRGPYLTGHGRQYEFEVDDINYLLHLVALRGTGAKRPAETRSARMAWLLGYATGLSGLVYDNGLVDVDLAPMEESDYRGKYPDDVLSDLCITTRIFFVYWDNAASQASLFFNFPLATVKDSSLRLSNVDGEADRSTTFDIHPDPEWKSDGSQIYCGVTLVYRNGRVYRHNATTHALYFATSGLHRTAIVESDRIGQESTAISRADAFLIKHQLPIVTVTAVVKLPAAKLNDIEAGDRLPVWLEHLPGLDDSDYVNVRVSRKTWPIEMTNGYYDVTLELNVSGQGIGSGGGGGDPGTFPTPPPTDPVHFYDGTMTATTEEYGDAGSPIVGGVDTGWIPPLLTDGTLTSSDIEPRDFVAGVTYNYTVTFITDVADADLGTRQFGIGATGLWSEFHVSSDTPPNPLSFSGSFTPLVSFGGYFIASTVGAGHIHHPFTVSWVIDPDGWDDGSTPNAPLPGQWVGISPPEIVTMSGADGTTVWPFADGALIVLHDGFDQSIHIASYDGAAGTFTLDYTPGVGATITVRYQGR